MDKTLYTVPYLIKEMPGQLHRIIKINSIEEDKTIEEIIIDILQKHYKVK